MFFILTLHIEKLIDVAIHQQQCSMAYFILTDGVGIIILISVMNLYTWESYLFVQLLDWYYDSVTGFSFFLMHDFVAFLTTYKPFSISNIDDDHL